MHCCIRCSFFCFLSSSLSSSSSLGCGRSTHNTKTQTPHTYRTQRTPHAHNNKHHTHNNHNKQVGASKWGKVADTKGRLIVLYISLISGIVFSFGFGLSTNYGAALMMRLLMGLFCDVSSITKVCVSELAGNDAELEAKSMNLVVTTWAMASCLSPAIAGGLADPVKQYDPDSFLLLRYPPVNDFLSKYRYFLPNLVGVLLCLVGIPIVKLNLRETLLVAACDADDDDEPQQQPTEESPLLQAEPSTAKGGDIDNNFDETCILSPEAVALANEQAEEQTMRDAYLYSDDFEGIMTTDQSRKSMALSIYRRTTTTAAAKQKHLTAIQEQDQEQHVREESGPPTLKTFLKDASNRNHFLVYCLGLFLIHFNHEAFPLFCLSETAGLGVSESTIGGIMLASGITHSLIQPSIYSRVFARRGLKGSIRWAVTAAIPIFLMIPFSLLSKGVGSDHLRWTALTFLGITVGMGRVFTVTFYSSISVSMNRLVPPKYRATFNGTLTKISGQCRGLAPITAGFFTSWAFSSGVVPPRGWGAVLLYATIGAFALLVSMLSFLLLGTDDEKLV